MIKNIKLGGGFLGSAIERVRAKMVPYQLSTLKDEVPDDPDFCIPFGEARVARPGTDVTIIATQLYLQRALEAADILEQDGISAEVIDPRTLVPFDFESVDQSVQKTGRVVIVHEAHKFCGIGAEISAMIAENSFWFLEGPIKRLGAKQCPLPFNQGLEKGVVPQVDEIIDAVKSLI